MIVPKPSSTELRARRAVCVLSVITARKADFVECALRQLRGGAPMPPGFVAAVVDAIAKLDWKFFVTERETVSRVLNLSTDLAELNRDAIWLELDSALDDWAA